ncbi:DNA ligase (NAD+) [Metamycoplasma subdolum]|uniref:DNA ligase n=1 Tax=Metamycoplasma subdolum TaxID=92407 RepID=A0A3M0AEB9_9BACT|nr:NAD-dependent DNA ligase LigA [Metamycoplasma subdolum]RMA77522.1 DNA ligase (NAD+) [Metamycoplasma subdolum]WPB50714.1 NAD-dependent DNA ligase LigA [Metamycoplasma subdolum]
MNEKDLIRKRYFELRDKIVLWDNAYYNEDKPLVEDAIYDKAYNELKELEKQYASYFSLDELASSPTQKINAKASDLFTKVTHKTPMLSLNKAYTFDEINKFINNVKKVTTFYSFFVEPKIDGLSISLTYENGKLIRAVTRGDGKVGEDVTNNVFQIKDIPKRINYSKSLEVRGEVYLSIPDFENLNLTFIKEGKSKFANPRNAAAGTLRQLNSDIVKKRNLSSFIYYVVSPEEHEIKMMQDSFEFLKNLNFHVSDETKLCKNLDEIISYIENFKHRKTHLDYETDGIVIKLNELEFYEKLGFTATFPHSAIAFKYEPNTAVTIIEDIFITIGRTGVATYNAKLDPVEISGSTVSSATLNNYQYIQELNLSIGDLVYIKKAGEIIPCVIGLVNEKENKENFIKKITICPYCGKNLFDNETGLEQYCLNELCPEIQRRKLIHFASKDAMDLNGFGEKVIDLFHKNNLLNKITDFYNLPNKINEIRNINSEDFEENELIKNELSKLRQKKNKLEKIEKNSMELAKLREKISKLQSEIKRGKTFRDGLIKIYLKSLEESKTKSLDRLIFAFSIKLIGSKVATFIASKVEKLENFLTFDFDSLIHFDEIGPKIVDSLKKWVSEKENQTIVNEFINLGLNFEYKSNKLSDKFDRKTFVITGTLSKPRSYFEKIIVQNGGKVSESVSKSTHYLIVGEDAGSKLMKAKALNIPIITEEEFEKLLNN